MTIVIGFSADQYGSAALDHGLAEAKVRGAAVRVINSSKGDSWTDPKFASADGVVRLEEALAASGVPHEIHQEVGDDAGDTLLDAMAAEDAELLVIGIRHRTPVGKLLLGSTAQRLLLNCPKPVLAVKPAE
ncbi:universal stress protein [Aldersonia kunmingensis]|uniref:universal stress protein n=1 Tax=Aldersonia kunmingensis TaxID=408066 RepID=UPI00082A1176|nr:universal stress protein [Aldersonia kunmingensis]